MIFAESPKQGFQRYGSNGRFTGVDVLCVRTMDPLRLLTLFEIMNFGSS